MRPATARRRDGIVGGLLAAVLLLGGAVTVEAQAPGAAAPDTLRARMSVAPSVVGLGERVHLRMAVAVPDTTARLLAPPAPLALGKLDVVASREVAAGRDSLAWELELALFELGDLDVGGIPFALEHGGTAIPVALPSYRVTVEGTIPPDSLAEAALRDIRGPLDTPVQIVWWRVIAAVAVLAGAAWLLRRWWRNRSLETERVLPAAPAIPPDLRALRALDDLEREALPRRGMIKEHYFRLSLILRGYVEARHGVPAVESTSFELRSALDRTRVLDPAGAERLLDLLEEADLVKFARFDPGIESAEAALARGREWIGSAAGSDGAEPLAAAGEGRA